MGFGRAAMWGLGTFAGCAVTSAIVVSNIEGDQRTVGARMAIGMLVAFVISVLLTARVRAIRFSADDNEVRIKNLWTRRRLRWDELTAITIKPSHFHLAIDASTYGALAFASDTRTIKATATVGIDRDQRNQLELLARDRGIPIDDEPIPKPSAVESHPVLIATMTLIAAAITGGVLTENPLTAMTVVGVVVFLVVVHEAGHAVVATLCGLTVTNVRIGTGPLISQITLNSVRLEFRLVPVAGAVTWTHPNVRVSRSRLALVFIAGVGAATAAVVLLWPFVSDELRVVLAIALGLEAMNLLPATTLSPSGLPTDGAKLVALFRGRPTRDPLHELTVRLVELRNRDPRAAVELAARIHTVHPSDASWVNLMTCRMLVPEDEIQRADLDRLTRIWNDSAIPRKSDIRLDPVAVCLNFCAYAQLLAGDTLPPTTLVALGDVHAAAPTDPAIADTLAWGLISAGDVARGLELSEQSLHAVLPEPQRAAQLAVQAIGFAAAARFDEAHENRAEVVRLDPACPVLPHLDQALDTRSTGQQLR